jgi:hypothetical protein
MLGSFSVQNGLLVDGHTYLCRGTYANAEQQSCGATTCAHMRAAAGMAAAPAPTGAMVAHCASGALCNQAVEASRDVLAMSCGLTGSPVEAGPCADALGGAPRLGVCTVVGGTEWVYYAAAGATLESAQAQCGRLSGTFSTN